MIEKQPSERPRPPTDISHLSPEDRQAFERVAAILNKPLSELYEDNPQHTSVGPRGTAVDPLIGGHAMHTSPQIWLSTTDWQDLNGWPQNIRHDGIGNHAPQLNGSQPSGSIFEQEPESSVYQWTEHTSQGPTAQIRRRGNTPDADSQTWFSVPTEYLTQDCHQVGMVDNNEAGTRSERPGVVPASNASAVPPQCDPLTSNGSPTQDRDATNWQSSPPSALDSDLVDLGWVDVKAAQHSSFVNQPTYAGEATTSEWSMVRPSKKHETILLDNSNPKSVTWVSTDSTGKELSPKKKRGPFQDQQLREQTSDTRKLKACVRCRMQKIRVSVHVFDALSTLSDQHSATPTPVTPAGCVKHVRMSRSKRSTLFLACGTSFQRLPSIELEKLQD
jgi:hypothetical protein